MNMNVKKQLRSLGRMLLPALGFTLTSCGAYLLSLQTERSNVWMLTPAYIMIVCGFLALIAGVLWTVCHSMKSKMYQRGGRERHIQIYTIERPNSFPPSYEQSQESWVGPDAAPESVMVDGLDVALGLAPPLYSQDGSEAPDCTWSWEQPPRYSQVERIQDEGQRGEASSAH